MYFFRYNINFFIKSYIIGDNDNNKECNNNYELMYIIRIHYNTEIFLHLCNQKRKEI